MHRTINNYKITKRKDGRYYVRIRDRGDVTHIYGKTKAEVKSKLEIKIEELNTLDRRRTVRSSFYATFMGFYRHITHLRNPTITNICSHKQNIMCSKF